jgi:hypothetical protein
MNTELMVKTANTAIMDCHGIKIETVVGLIEKAASEAVGIHSLQSVLQVNSNDTYVAAGQLTKRINQFASQVKDNIGPMKAVANKFHKAITAIENELLNPVETDKRDIDRKMSTWRQEQERARREAELEAQKAAARLLEEQQINEAARLEAAGENDEAQRVIEQELKPTPVVMPSFVPVIEGVSARKNYRARVVNPDLVPDSFWVIDETALGAYARAMKEKASVPGVEFYVEESQSVRQ